MNKIVHAFLAYASTRYKRIEERDCLDLWFRHSSLKFKVFTITKHVKTSVPNKGKHSIMQGATSVLNIGHWGYISDRKNYIPDTRY